MDWSDGRERPPDEPAAPGHDPPVDAGALPERAEAQPEAAPDADALSGRPFACPRCGASLALPPDVTRVRCGRCAWAGQVHLFDPVSRYAEPAADALPGDAACAHHPSKRAVDVCAGTGDYVCSLCAVELGGAVYSVDYVNRVGADNLAHHLQRYLPRPDRVVLVLMVLAILPCFWYCGPVLLVIAGVHYVRMLRQYHNDPLYRMAVGMPTLVAAPVLLVVWCGVYGLFGIAILFGM